MEKGCMKVQDGTMSEEGGTYLRARQTLVRALRSFRPCPGFRRWLDRRQEEQREEEGKRGYSRYTIPSAPIIFPIRG